MRKLSLILLLLAMTLFSANLFTDSPHGDGFNVPCDKCHSAKGWQLDKEIYSFDHNTTAFPLTGLHVTTGCRSCHVSLVFSQAGTECRDCHTDVHYQTVGPDCERCHTPESWIINDITGIHQASRFPLVGPHYTADCSGCHKSASQLRFEPLGITCYDCHRTDYEGTTQPNHVQSGFSTNCAECHLMTAFTWTGPDFNHSFFPLTAGHALSNCADCHVNGNYTNLSTECASCHLEDYEATVNPNHTASAIPTTCIDCHTTNPGWKPAEFRQHDGQYFPVYSGKHAGTWITCADCHTNPADYKSFTCIDCHDHNQQDMDEKHNEVGGYTYTSVACYVCHPTGDAHESFNHNLSGFPLTGAHIGTPCTDCHASGYIGTPTQCSACHMNNYTQTTNPNHGNLGLSNDCAVCHTTDPGWKPATFSIHNNYYVLEGAHALIANNCASCHNGNYTNTPNTCVGCHLTQYNQTTNPPHASAQFPTDCASCHTQSAWVPSTFNHDGLYFPIYSGKHQGTWNTCSDCHTNSSNYTIFSCIDCHEHNKTEMDDKHSGVPGYVYNSIACYNCHPTGSGGGKMMAPKNFRKQE